MEIAGSNLIRIFALTAVAFLAAMLWTPLLTHFLYKKRIQKQLRESTWDGKPAEIFRKMHEKKAGTPTMGGLLVWVTAAVVTVLFNFSRSQTWLPVFVLTTSGLLGFVDDFLNTRGFGKVRGLSTKIKFFSQFLIAGMGAWWFYFKLDFSEIRIPAAEFLGLPGSVDIAWA